MLRYRGVATIIQVSDSDTIGTTASQSVGMNSHPTGRGPVSLHRSQEPLGRSISLSAAPLMSWQTLDPAEFSSSILHRVTPLWAPVTSWSLLSHRTFGFGDSLWVESKGKW